MAPARVDSGNAPPIIIDAPHQWSTWAAPRKRDGSLGHDNTLTGDDLLDFVNLREHLTQGWTLNERPLSKALTIAGIRTMLT